MQALNRRLFALLVLAIGAALPLHLHAATVSIGNERFGQCWVGSFVLCDGPNAYSLTQLLNGTVHLPVSGDPYEEFVIVNDTGKAVDKLQLYFVGSVAANTSVNCGLEGDGWFFFSGCSLSAEGGPQEWSLRAPVHPPIEFTFYTFPWQWGIPKGAYFDVQVSDFNSGFGECGHGHDSHSNEVLTGYITGVPNGGSSSNPGGGNNGGNNGGPSY